MLNTQEETYLKGLILNYYDNGYKNYVCITNNPNNAYNTSYYDINCYFSASDIEQGTNEYTLAHNSYRCQIDSKSPTNTNKLDSLNCSLWQGNVNVNTKEFVYSNLPYHSNLIEEWQYQRFYTISIITLLCMILIYIWLKTLFKQRRNINE